MVHFGIPRRAVRAGKGNSEEVSLNWCRGLFRFWVLFSVAWLMGWTIHLVMYGLQGGFKTTGDYLVIPVLLLGPPIALLLFGIAAGWAFGGFIADSPSPENDRSPDKVV